MKANEFFFTSRGLFCHLHYKGAVSHSILVIWEWQIFRRTPVQWQKEREIEVWWDLLLSALYLKVSLSREGRRNIANFQVNVKELNFCLCNLWMNGEKYSMYFSFVPVLKLPILYVLLLGHLSFLWLGFLWNLTEQRKEFYDGIIWIPYLLMTC